MASTLVAMASTLVAMASTLVAMASTLVAMASTLVAMASTLVAMASTLVAMASKLLGIFPDAGKRLNKSRVAKHQEVNQVPRHRQKEPHIPLQVNGHQTDCHTHLRNTGMFGFFGKWSWISLQLLIDFNQRPNA